MSVTWEMIATVISILVGMFGGFRWIAGKFDKVAAQVGHLDKKKVSHKVCRQRRSECTCPSPKSSKPKGHSK